MLVVDRIENGQAVCETDAGTFVRIPVAECSGTVREGDVLVHTGTGYRVDDEETQKRREEIIRLSKDLFR